MPAASFTIAHHSFEGPLSVLLALIENKKMEVSRIALGEVAHDFATYISESEHVSLDEHAEALVILATLMLIKSRTLLPNFALSDDEELATHELEKRLALYALIKRTTPLLKKHWGETPLVGMYRAPARTIVFAPSNDLTLENMFTIMRTLITAFPVAEKREEALVQKTLSIEEMMRDVHARIEQAVKTSFKTLTEGKNRGETIVSFLAVLELVRHGILLAAQNEGFGDIMLDKDSSISL